MSETSRVNCDSKKDEHNGPVSSKKKKKKEQLEELKTVCEIHRKETLGIDLLLLEAEYPLDDPDEHEVKWEKAESKRPDIIYKITGEKLRNVAGKITKFHKSIPESSHSPTKHHKNKSKDKDREKKKHSSSGDQNSKHSKHNGHADIKVKKEKLDDVPKSSKLSAPLQESGNLKSEGKKESESHAEFGTLSEHSARAIKIKEEPSWDGEVDNTFAEPSPPTGDKSILKLKGEELINKLKAEGEPVVNVVDLDDAGKKFWVHGDKWKYSETRQRYLCVKKQKLFDGLLLDYETGIYTPPKEPPRRPSPPPEPRKKEKGSSVFKKPEPPPAKKLTTQEKLEMRRKPLWADYVPQESSSKGAAANVRKPSGINGPYSGFRIPKKEEAKPTATPSRLAQSSSGSGSYFDSDAFRPVQYPTEQVEILDSVVPSFSKRFKKSTPEDEATDAPPISPDAGEPSTPRSEGQRNSKPEKTTGGGSFFNAESFSGSSSSRAHNAGGSPDDSFDAGDDFGASAADDDVDGGSSDRNMPNERSVSGVNFDQARESWRAQSSFNREGRGGGENGRGGWATRGNRFQRSAFGDRDSWSGGVRARGRGFRGNYERGGRWDRGGYGRGSDRGGYRGRGFGRDFDRGDHGFDRDRESHNDDSSRGGFSGNAEGGGFGGNSRGGYDRARYRWNRDDGDRRSDDRRRDDYHRNHSSSRDRSRSRSRSPRRSPRMDSDPLSGYSGTVVSEIMQHLQNVKRGEQTHEALLKIIFTAVRGMCQNPSADLPDPSNMTSDTMKEYLNSLAIQPKQEPVERPAMENQPGPSRVDTRNLVTLAPGSNPLAPEPDPTNSLLQNSDLASIMNEAIQDTTRQLEAENGMDAQQPVTIRMEVEDDPEPFPDDGAADGVAPMEISSPSSPGMNFRPIVSGLDAPYDPAEAVIPTPPKTTYFVKPKHNPVRHYRIEDQPNLLAGGVVAVTSAPEMLPELPGNLPMPQWNMPVLPESHTPPLPPDPIPLPPDPIPLPENPIPGIPVDSGAVPAPAPALGSGSLESRFQSLIQNIPGLEERFSSLGNVQSLLPGIVLNPRPVSEQQPASAEAPPAGEQPGPSQVNDQNYDAMSNLQLIDQLHTIRDLLARMNTSNGVQVKPEPIDPSENVEEGEHSGGDQNQDQSDSGEFNRDAGAGADVGRPDDNSQHQEQGGSSRNEDQAGPSSRLIPPPMLSETLIRNVKPEPRETDSDEDDEEEGNDLPLSSLFEQMASGGEQSDPIMPIEFARM